MYTLQDDSRSVIRWQSHSHASCAYRAVPPLNVNIIISSSLIVTDLLPICFVTYGIYFRATSDL